MKDYANKDWLKPRRNFKQEAIKATVDVIMVSFVIFGIFKLAAAVVGAL